MCLFKRWRKTKDIKLKQDISTYLVFPYSLKNGCVYLERQAEVPENYVLVFSTRNRILDVLPKGNHTLGPVILPKCSKKFKLFKRDRYGREPKNFKAFAYFVNLSEVNDFDFSTFKPIAFKNDIDGKFKVYIEFACSLRVENHERLLKSLFSEYSYFKLHEPEEIISNWLSEEVYEYFQKTPHRLSDFEEKLSDLLVVIYSKQEKFLKSIGIELKEFIVKKLVISKPKKGSKKTENVVYNSQDIQNLINNQNMLDISEISQKDTNKEQPNDFEKLKPNRENDFEFENNLTELNKPEPEEEQNNKKSNNSWVGLEKFWKK